MYSVLMSVYYKENPAFLKESMESIYCQTVPTDDFVLVCDGPLGSDLSAVIDEMKGLFGDSLRIVQLEKNMGLGKALGFGLKSCKHELVARMDSDDIARPYRMEKQLKCFEENKDLSMLSATVEEFDEGEVYATRQLPLTHEEILKFAKVRNPFNHPCMMYKKSAVISAHGYQPFYLLEDYYLWVRMLANGSIGMNIEEPLLWMRAGSEMYRRRGGLKYAISQAKFVCFMYRSRFIGFKQLCISIPVRVGGALLPDMLRQKIYEKKLRRRKC